MDEVKLFYNTHKPVERHGTKTLDLSRMKKIICTCLLAATLAGCNNSGATKGDAPEATTKENDQPSLPPGKYNVYQSDGFGFNYQYHLFIKDAHTYAHNKLEDEGEYSYDPSRNYIEFKTGKLKDFLGRYRLKNPTNPADPPTIVLMYGEYPDSTKEVGHAYQYGYFQDPNKK